MLAMAMGLIQAGQMERLGLILAPADRKTDQHFENCNTAPVATAGRPPSRTVAVRIKRPVVSPRSFDGLDPGRSSNAVSIPTGTPSRRPPAPRAAMHQRQAERARHKNEHADGRQRAAAKPP